MYTEYILDEFFCGWWEGKFTQEQLQLSGFHGVGADVGMLEVDVGGVVCEKHVVKKSSKVKKMK